MNKLAPLQLLVFTLLLSKLGAINTSCDSLYAERQTEGVPFRLWMVNPRTFAIHRSPPCCMYTGAVLSYILKGRGSLAKHINKPVVSVYISLCMWLLSYRDHFKVFNASVQYFQMVRPLLQPGLCIHVVPSLRQVVQSLEEVDNQDRSWRAELMMQVSKATMLQYCLFINKS